MVVSEDMKGNGTNLLCGRKCEIDSELDIKEATRWIQLARDVVQRRDIVDTGMNLWISLKVVDVLTR